MKHILKELIRKESDNQRRRNLTREYLQGRILQALQNQRAFSSWAFLGGTALRFLYNLPRYSEDLDFSLTKSSYTGNF
jgi:predicted nucleotidyltransferase component of viral defense system